MNKEKTVPITEIRKLVKCAENLDAQIRKIKDTYNKDAAYIRGLLKQPTK